MILMIGVWCLSKNDESETCGGHTAAWPGTRCWRRRASWRGCCCRSTTRTPLSLAADWIIFSGRLSDLQTNKHLSYLQVGQIVAVDLQTIGYPKKHPSHCNAYIGSFHWLLIFHLQASIILICWRPEPPGILVDAWWLTCTREGMMSR